MRKFSVLFVLLILLSSTAFAADRWYTVEVTDGSVNASSSGVAGLPGSVPTTTVMNLDGTEAPGTTVASIVQLATASLPVGSWNAAGWWTFDFTGTSLTNWNDVFAGGNWEFTADWVSTTLGPVHFGIESATFDAMYGKWYMNNPSVYTYFGLYFPPNTQNLTPTGIFAFVADDPLLYPSGFDLSALYTATEGGEPIAVSGTGRFEATYVPEPSILLLLGLGLGAVSLVGLRKK